jgi:Zn-finger nucleic acid-binding protein
MKLICPTCPAESGLKIKRAENSPLSHVCDSCNGTWISWNDYYRWLESRTEPLVECDDFDKTFDLNDSDAARVCPECSVILSRYRIGHGVPFRLDYCRRCNGVWFDANEWAVIRAKNLHDKVNRFFTAGWQNDVRRGEQAKHRESDFRSRLGSDGYRLVVEFKDWLKNQEHKGAVIAFLNEVPSHQTYAKVMDPELRQLGD